MHLDSRHERDRRVCACMLVAHVCARLPRMHRDQEGAKVIACRFPMATFEPIYEEVSGVGIARWWWGLVDVDDVDDED